MVFHRGRFSGSVSDARFSPDGSSLAIGVPDGVVIWNIASNKESHFLEGCGLRIAFSPDGRKREIKSVGCRRNRATINAPIVLRAARALAR